MLRLVGAQNKDLEQEKRIARDGNRKISGLEGGRGNHTLVPSNGLNWARTALAMVSNPSASRPHRVIDRRSRLQHQGKRARSKPLGCAAVPLEWRPIHTTVERHSEWVSGRLAGPCRPRQAPSRESPEKFDRRDRKTPHGFVNASQAL